MSEKIIIDKEFKELCPALSVEEREQLANNIIAEGCRDALVIWKEENILIDGHNRYQICTKNEIPFKTIELNFSTRQEVKSWIITNQLGRRNLTAEKFAYMIGKLYQELKQQHGGDRKSKAQNEPLITTAERIAEEYKIGHATVKRAAEYANAIDTLAENLGEKAKEKILNREIDVTRQEVIDLAKEEKKKQKEIIDDLETSDGKTGRVSHKSFKIDMEKRNIGLIEKAHNLPSGKYRVIYADPPWSYGNTMPEYFTDQEDHYPTMSLKEICAIPIEELAAENAVLFLWVTSPILEEAFTVISSWGFKYKTSFVWDKVKHNMGHYNSVRHELLLVCTRGSCQPDVKKLYDSVVSIERTKHSEKPEHFREIIDTIYPNGKRIELFARKRYEKWDSYGNEL